MAVQQEKSKQSPQTKKERHLAYLEKHLCSFQTSGRRCQIIGGISSGTTGPIKERWCAWHYLTLDNSRSQQSFNDFKEYRENDRETYPSEWLHADLYIEDEIAWQATLGKTTYTEYMRYVVAKEREYDEMLKKYKPVSKNPTQEVANSFEDIPF